MIIDCRELGGFFSFIGRTKRGSPRQRSGNQRGGTRDSGAVGRVARSRAMGERSRRCDRMAGGTIRNGSMHAMVTTEQRREVLYPGSKLACCDTRRIITRIVQDTKDTVCQEISNRTSHAGKPIHEEVDRVVSVEVKRRTGSMRSISPGVEMIEPARVKKSDRQRRDNSHVNKDDAEGPDISSTRAVSGCHVVPAFWGNDKLCGDDRAWIMTDRSSCKGRCHNPYRMIRHPLLIDRNQST